eukprot:244251-Amphidinium_carterae.1
MCDTWWIGVTHIVTTVISLSLASLWTVIVIPNGDALWADGTTHHSPPFLVETMTEDQVRMFIKAKDPMVLIEDDAEDEAANTCSSYGKHGQTSFSTASDSYTSSTSGLSNLG